MKPKKKPTPMPQVWGQKPSFYAFGCRKWRGRANICDKSKTSDQTSIEITTELYATEALALRAIRKLWRETFGGGE